jgi:hypothetical protein
MIPPPLMVVCSNCEGDIGHANHTKRYLYCNECDSRYHYWCWREYHKLHGSNCRVCDERQAEAEAEESKGG